VQSKRLSSATYYDLWVQLERVGPVGLPCRHVDAVNNDRHDIDQIYTAALTLKFAKVAVYNVWLPVGHVMR